MFEVIRYNNTPKEVDVSIIIPTYKTDYKLKECLESIASQLSSDLFVMEIILVLNGEKYPYLDYILDVLGTIKISDISILYSFEKGVSRARNIGLEQSKGKYVCFIDDDDWISENYIYELLNIAKKRKMGLANMIDYKNNQFQNSYFTSQFNSLVNSSKSLSILNTRSWFSVPVLKVLDRKIIQNKKFNEKISNGEDSLFMFDIMTFHPKLELAPTATYYRRVCDDGLTQTLNKKKWIKRLHHACKLSSLFFIHYIMGGCKQNFLFFITRVLAPFKSLIN